MTFTEFCKTLDWQKIINVCSSVDDLNDSQYRFVKGRFIELLVENLSNKVLVYIGDKHKDFVSKQYNCSVELKSQTSTGLYLKKGNLRSTFTVRFNNSMGNNKEILDPLHVADYLIIVMKDGAVLVNKDTILQNLVYYKDGYTLKLRPQHVIELTGKMSVLKTYNLNLKQKIDNLLLHEIQNI